MGKIMIKGNKEGTAFKMFIAGMVLFLYVLLGLVEINIEDDLRVKEVSSSLIVATDIKAKKSFIKWVDFKVTYEALQKAYEYDISTYGKEIHLDFIELLAYAGAKHGGVFDEKALKTIDKLADELINKEITIESITQDMQYYAYYLEAYSAVLKEYVGEYRIEVTDENGNASYKECYGLRCFHPIAYGFPYSDYDDFGASRSYGYKRVHLGHDMMGQTGTPIIAIESGVVEALGWNQYGGWRIGIRSYDGLRYYYYAHMRKDRPYALNLKQGDEVIAGDVIGYMGHTGYSVEENVNNIEVTHLHMGIQLIFDESQKDGNGEIWIDCYALTKFLYKNRSRVVRDDSTKEWYRETAVEIPFIPKK